MTVELEGEALIVGLDEDEPVEIVPEVFSDEVGALAGSVEVPDAGESVALDEPVVVEELGVVVLAAVAFDAVVPFVAVVAVDVASDGEPAVAVASVVELGEDVVSAAGAADVVSPDAEVVSDAFRAADW